LAVDKGRVLGEIFWEFDPNLVDLEEVAEERTGALDEVGVVVEAVVVTCMESMSTSLALMSEEIKRKI
jgi:hypothetical protein